MRTFAAVAGLFLSLIAATGGAREGDEYRIGADDILRVTVYGNDELNQTVLVQADGAFMFPLIGRVQASSLTPKELEQEITTRLAKGFIRAPQVSVSVQEYRSQTVFVMGEVSKPGTYPLSGRTTLVEILSKAGPSTSNAGREVVVVRPAGPVHGPILPPENADPAQAASQPVEVMRVDLRDIESGQLEKNLVLHPNDTVFVPQAPRVYVTGEVRNPGAYPFITGASVRQAISLAGGYTERASSRIRVARSVDGKTRELKIQLDDLVQPGDTIVVKEKLF